MIKGRFGNTSGRPYVEARLAIPRFQIIGDISFLLDTGADKTALMPLDAGRIGIDYNQLTNKNSAVGIGGANDIYVEPAIMAFSDSDSQDKLYVYKFDLNIVSEKPEILSIPSLIGRDIINKWVITYDHPNNSLAAEVVYATVVLPVAAVPVLPPAQNGN